jgi:hypothetical protein
LSQCCKWSINNKKMFSKRSNKQEENREKIVHIGIIDAPPPEQIPKQPNKEDTH